MRLCRAAVCLLAWASFATAEVLHYENLGLCRSNGKTAYRYECSDKKEVRMCQYINATCSGFERCATLPGYNPTETCITRRHFGGAASVEFQCD